MPEMRSRRLMVALIFIGVILSCAGMITIFTAPTMNDPQISTGNLLLCGAWLILVPIFLYMIRLRSAARRTRRRELTERKEELDQQLTQMVTPEGIRAIGGGEPNTTSLDAEDTAKGQEQEQQR